MESDPMEPMLASTGTANAGGSTTTVSGPGFFTRVRSFFCGKSSKDTIAPYQELIISPKVYKRSVNCLRFAVFVDAIAGTIEQPNYREYTSML